MTGLGKVGAAMAVSFGAFGSALGIGAADPEGSDIFMVRASSKVS